MRGILEVMKETCRQHNKLGQRLVRIKNLKQEILLVQE